MQKIGFAGIGLMGRQMTRRLLHGRVSLDDLEPHERQGQGDPGRGSDMGGIPKGAGARPATSSSRWSPIRPLPKR